VTLAPGIHPGVPAATYHAGPTDRPSLSASIAHILTSCSPRHAWTAHPQLNPDFKPDESAHFDLGTAAHALLLQGEVVHVVDAPDWRRQDAQDVRARAHREGLVPLLAHQWRQVQEMVAAVRAQLDLLDVDPPMFCEGKAEQTLVWEDRGVLCRARVDWLRDDLQAIDDLKTTGKSAHPADWTRSTLWSIGADVEMAFHQRGVMALTGTLPQFRFLVVECRPPYAVQPVSLDPSALELANEKVDAAIDRWRHCLEHDDWPAYARQVAYAEAPGWVMTDWMARDSEQVTA
jgi:hypothetical protein